MSPLVSNGVQRFPLAHFKPSPTNPRKRFSPDKLAELAESIKRLDVLQPVLSRPNPDHAEGNGQPLLELVAGERRWRASQLAEASDLPTLVKDLTDLDVLDIQLVENIERDDLHPLEEAEGMRRLLDASAKAGKPLAAEGLAIKLGKSPRWVFLRLELLNLCDEAREAFLEDTINASVAGLIARMPNVDQQREATARILTGFNGEPFTYRAAAEYLRKEFMLDLARAPFNIHAIDYKVATACTVCPKRSGSKPDLFDDVKIGDLCQDSKCYAAKSEEAHQRLLQACREAGHRVVQGDDARKLLSGEVAIDSGHCVASEPCPTLTADKRTLFDIFGNAQKGFVTIEHPTTHALVTWVPAKIVKKALQAKGLLRPAAPAPAPTPVAAPAPRMAAAPAPQADEARPALKPQPLTPKQLESQIAYRTGELFTSTLLASLCKSLAQAEAPPLSILQLLCIEKLLTASDEAADLLRGQVAAFPDLSEHSPSARRAAAQRHIAPLNGRELADLLGLLLVAEELSNQDDLHTLETYSNYAVALAADLQLDTAAMQSQAEQWAAEQVQAEEDNRLGRNAAGEAFAAALGAAA